MWEAILVFVKWFFVTGGAGLLVGGALGGAIGTDARTSMEAGEALAVIIFPSVLIVSLLGTIATVSREKMRRAKGLSEARISDFYQKDRNGVE